jgi:hypothetical protein
VPDARLLGGARDVDGVLEVLGGRLLAIDVLAGCNRLVQQLGAQLGGGGIEEQRVLGVLQRGIEVGGPARDAVCLRQLRELALVAADQDRIGHDGVAVAQRDAALGADRHDRPNQMLVHPHAAGDAVHDDAETLLRHFFASSCLALRRQRGARAMRAPVRRYSRPNSR